MGFPLTWMAWALLLLAHSAGSQNCTASGLQYQALSTQDVEALDGDAGSLQPLYNMVQSYLGAVQPNSFDSGLIANIVTDPQFIQNEYGQVLKYVAGYLVCFIIAVLYFVLMPLVGLFFCCCRCCGNCGGRVRKRTKATACQRNSLATFLLLTTIVILAGVACAFTANQKQTDILDLSVTEIRASITNIRNYFNGIVQNIGTVKQQFSIPKDVVANDVAGFDRVVGNQLLEGLREPLIGSLDLLSARQQDIENSTHHLLVVNNTKASLQQTELNLNSLRIDINQTLNNASCVGCDGNLVNDLKLNGSYSTILAIFLPVVNKVMMLAQNNLSLVAEEGKRKVNEIPTTVSKQLAPLLSDFNTTLDNIEKEISNFTNSLSLLDSLPSVSGQLATINDNVSTYSMELKRYDYYRWSVGIVLCCIILLIIVCNLLGLVLGTTGTALRDDPYSANGCSQSGANFLMAGVGFSFLFSWLLILLVFVTFFVGGLAYTEVCKPWATGDIYKLFDEIGSRDNQFSISSMFKLNVSVSVTEVYSGCKNGGSLWTILQLNRTYNLDEKLDVKKYTGEFESKLKSLKVNLSNFTLLNSRDRNTLQDFANSGIQGIANQTVTNQVSSLEIQNLATVIQALETLVSRQNDISINNTLNAHIQSLKDLEQKQRQLVVNLTASLAVLKEIGSTLEASVNETLATANAAQLRLKTDPGPLVENVTDCFIAKETGYFENYLQWVRKAITEDILACRVASVILDNSRVISCEFFLHPWNAFWFCLAWCTLFLIPSIIFAVKTAKHFRPIQGLNKVEPSEMTNFKLPRAQFTPDMKGV